MTTNPIKIIDEANSLNRKVINGALVVSQLGDHYTVSANTLTPLADMWYAKTDFTSSTVTRNELSYSECMRTRHSPYSLRFTPGGTGTFKSVFFMVPNLSDMAGHVCTLQLFAKAATTAKLRIISKAAFRADTIVSAELKPEIVILSSEFQEFTVPFWLPYHADLNKDSWFMLELSMPDSPDWYEFTGVRINRGEFGLCHSNDYLTEGETLARVQNYFEQRSIVRTGSGISEWTVDMAPKVKPLATAAMTFTRPSKSPITGVEVKGGVKFSFGHAIPHLEAVVDFDTQAFYF